VRRGFTTGSCAAAAAKAAAFMLLAGKRKEQITITTPAGAKFVAELLNVERTAEYARCGVRKDGGDDPDVTTGAIVYATVARKEGAESGDVEIDGGEGVGRVTKPGLDQPVGAPAINSVPRQMIEREVRDVMTALDYRGSLRVVVSVPEGAEIARRTFNPRFGIEGGVSILGTSGIVEPMSVQALLETIRVEIRQNCALGRRKIIVAPGNYGLEFIQKRFGFNPDMTVKCANYIGETIDMASELGVTDLLLCGALGKLIKTSGGILNTHSKVADCRMALMAASAVRAGASIENVRDILECVSTDAAYDIVRNAGIAVAFMADVMKEIDFHLKKRAAGRLRIECVVFSQTYGELGRTPGANAMIEAILEETKRWQRNER
jgi:cobalt-precorrin-5B (C1)-methyltransferase